MKVFLVPTKSFEWHIDGDFPLKSQSIKCYGASKQIGILSDGRVVPCCIDYEGRSAFGYLQEGSLDGILNSQKFRDFAQSLRSGQAPCDLCKKCGYHLILKNHP